MNVDGKPYRTVRIEEDGVLRLYLKKSRSVTENLPHIAP